MDLREMYEITTGKKPYIESSIEHFTFTNDYAEWLETCIKKNIAEINKDLKKFLNEYENKDHINLNPEFNNAFSDKYDFMLPQSTSLL